MIGIYTITNIINNKIYIGYTNNFIRRKNDHFSYLKRNVHKNIHLQKAYNKYGRDNFIFEILEECEESYLCSQEHYWCNMLNTHNKNYGYNILPTHPDKIASTHSKETKIKISNSTKGVKKSLETIEKLKAVYKPPLSQITKTKISNWYKENLHPMKKGHSLESKQKMSDFRKGKPSNNRRNIFSTNEHNLIIKFKSLTEASVYYEILITSITNNLKNKSKMVKTKFGKIKFNYE